MLNKKERVNSILLDWCNREAKRIIGRDSKPLIDNSTIFFETGFSPSGIPHVGTLCEAIRTSFVQKALEEMTGLKTKLFIVSDDFDALKNIPKNFPNQNILHNYYGQPLKKVPDPFEKFESLSANINHQLVSLLNAYDVQFELISSGNAYTAGHYNHLILKFLQHYQAINQIIKNSVGPIRRRSYNFIMPISLETGRIIEHCEILAIDLKNATFTYKIPDNIVIQKPGLEYGVTALEYYPQEKINQAITVSVLDGHCKLQWKADWCMRIIQRNIAFEMHGEDLTDSAKVVSQLCNLLNYQPPAFF